MKILTPSKWVGTLRHTVTINPTSPGTRPYNWDGTPNFQLLLEEQRIWTTHLASKLLRLPVRGGIPKHQVLKDNRACIHIYHKTTAKRQFFPLLLLLWHNWHITLKCIPWWLDIRIYWEMITVSLVNIHHLTVIIFFLWEFSRFTFSNF